jgi:hypothetical protein
MKDIDKKDTPEVSGGIAPDDDCFPPLPYPTEPIVPLPWPLPGTIDPALVAPDA